MANKFLPKTVSLTNVIPFDQPATFIPVRSISGAITFAKDTTGAQAGFGAIHRVVANGANTPDLSAFKLIGPGNYVNSNGVINQLWFVFDGYDYCVSITQPAAISGGGGGGGDTTPPVLLTAVIVDAHPNQVVLNFNEALDNTILLTNSQFVVTVDGADRTTTSTGVSGAAVIVNFNGAAVTAGQTVVIDYSDSPQPITDVAGNPYPPFTNHSVTNSISGGGGGTGTALSFTSVGGDIVASGTVWNPVPSDSTYNHHAISTTKRASGTAAKCWFKWEYPGATENFFMLMTSQTEGNATDAKVAFGVEAQTIISSIMADGLTDHANINSEIAPLFLGFDIAADGTIKLQKSNDESTWTDLWTFSVTYTGDLWVGIRLYGTGAVKDPKSTNFV